MKKTTTLLSALFTLILFSSVQAQIDTTHFVTTWQTDSVGFSNDSAIYIEVDTAYNYNFDIDWDNDGIFDTIGVDTSILIQYSSPGTYTIRIKGTYPSIHFTSIDVFPNTTLYDQKKLISVEQWGTNPWQNLENAFSNCSNLQSNATDAPDLTNVTSLYNMFAGASSFNADLNNWDVSTISSMSYLFENAINFNGDISAWDVSNVRNMVGMFAGTHAFNQDISNWDVSKVYDMDVMFAGSAFNQDISNWNMTSVYNTSGMFLLAYRFNQDLSNWNIQNTRRMISIFDYSGLSRSNYDSILIAWEAKPHQMNVTFGADQLSYCLGDSARSLLIADGWSFGGDTYDCFAIGLEENSWEADIKFYPNPVINQVTIDTRLTVQQVNIYSIVGSIVKSTSEKSLFIDDLPQGNYILEIVTEYGSKKELLVKQ